MTRRPRAVTTGSSFFNDKNKTRVSADEIQRPTEVKKTTNIPLQLAPYIGKNPGQIEVYENLRQDQIDLLTGYIELNAGHIRHIYFVNCNMLTQRNLNKFLTALSKCKTLQTLRFISCKFDDTHAKNILEAIEDLPISSFIFSDNTMGRSALSALTDFLQKNTMLVELTLCANHLDGQDILALATCSSAISQLRLLSLSDNNLSMDQGNGLNKLLSLPLPKLKKLSLMLCQLSDDILVKVQPSLAQLTSLENLFVDGNLFTKKGLVALSELRKKLPGVTISDDQYTSEDKRKPSRFKLFKKKPKNSDTRLSKSPKKSNS